MNTVETLRGDSGRDPASDSRPISEIADDIWQKAEMLIRQEMKLGITDAQERLEVLRDDVETRIDHLKVEVAVKAAAGAFVLVGVLALASAIILALSNAIPPWLAAAIVGVVVLGGGAALLRTRWKASPPLNTSALKPDRSIESVKKDIQALEETIK